VDAGWWELAEVDDGQVDRIVNPPDRPMFDQLVEYLSSLPQAYEDAFVPPVKEAMAATAVCLRWGTYFAVLSDPAKPLWSDGRRTGISRISDSEMARINIEASAAMEEWIEILRSDPAEYYGLVSAACTLPMPMRSVVADRRNRLVAFAQQQIARMILRNLPGVASDVQDEVRDHATRVLANAVTNSCWRNGPIEDIHAGKSVAVPLARRRVTREEDRMLMRSMASMVVDGLDAVHSLILEESTRSWAERVLPFRLFPLIAPSGWSLTERTRMVRLAGTEPPQS